MDKTEHVWKALAKSLARGRYPTCDHCYYLPGIWSSMGRGPCLPLAPFHPFNPHSGQPPSPPPPRYTTSSSPLKQAQHTLLLLEYSFSAAFTWLIPLFLPFCVSSAVCLQEVSPTGSEDHLPFPSGQLWAHNLSALTMLQSVCLSAVSYSFLYAQCQAEWHRVRSERAKWPLGLKRITAVPLVQQNLSEEKGKIFPLLFRLKTVPVSLGLGAQRDCSCALS